MKTTKPNSKAVEAKRTNIWLEIFGWLGPVAILLGFILVSYEIIEPRSYTFQLLNLFGSIAIAAISLAKRAFQPAVMNIVFIFIAMFTLITIWLS